MFLALLLFMNVKASLSVYYFYTIYSITLFISRIFYFCFLPFEIYSYFLFYQSIMRLAHTRLSFFYASVRYLELNILAKAFCRSTLGILVPTTPKAYLTSHSFEFAIPLARLLEMGMQTISSDLSSGIYAKCISKSDIEPNALEYSTMSMPSISSLLLLPVVSKDIDFRSNFSYYTPSISKFLYLRVSFMKLK